MLIILRHLNNFSAQTDNSGHISWKIDFVYLISARPVKKRLGDRRKNPAVLGLDSTLPPVHVKHAIPSALSETQTMHFLRPSHQQLLDLQTKSTQASDAWCWPRHDGVVPLSSSSQADRNGIAAIIARCWECRPCIQWMAMVCHEQTWSGKQRRLKNQFRILHFQLSLP